MNKHTDTAIVQGQPASLEDGRRRINLNQGEREALANQRRMEAAIALFLDVNEDRTWEQIANEVGMSVSALKRLTRTQEFEALYQKALSEIGHDPRYQAIVSSLPDLLPAARRRLKKIIESSDTPDGVALRGIEKLFEWTGANQPQDNGSPEALRRFLSENGVVVQGDLNLMQINIPPEFRAAFEKHLNPQSGEGHEIVDGLAEEVDTPEEDTSKGDLD